MKRFLKPHWGSPMKIIRKVQIVSVMYDEDPDADIEFHWFIEPEGFVFEDWLSGADDQILDMHGPFATEAEAVANVRIVLPQRHRGAPERGQTAMNKTLMLAALMLAAAACTVTACTTARFAPTPPQVQATPQQPRAGQHRDLGGQYTREREDREFGR